jgi:V/A-type H+-transporting ATPase subunit I
VLYIKERPTPDDETPVELHNSPVARPFEFIAEMYALPRYGTMDLTRWFAPFFPTNDMFLFVLALGLGVAQILFGMVLKAITTTRAFGIKYALATIGWITVITCGLALTIPGMADITLPIPRPALWSGIGLGAFMMLFLNNPGKNPLVNLGGGLWNTYNDITGFLSDALSYIRLFAIGLSGGVLATVFNDLALGMSPDIPVIGQLVTLIILLIGHGLNLFMSTLSSMVHPLRLTFVEFYKNAGFEASQRNFEPLKKTITNNK